jgi:hypothetical protein
VTVDAYRERYRYARDRTALLCSGLCRRHKPRTEFRKTPNHGRAAACLDCEVRGLARGHYERQTWLLEQEREKTRALTKHLIRVKAQRDRMARAMTSGDVVRYVEIPFQDAMERRRKQLEPFIDELWRALQSMKEES